MGFQGQLGSVQLADLFQTFAMNRQTGTLTVSETLGIVHIYFEQGQIALCSAPSQDGVPFLLGSLVRKGVIPQDQQAALVERLQSSREPLRDLIINTGFLTPADLDEVCNWCIEEVICPLFELEQAEFTFTDGDPLEELLGTEAIEMGEGRVSTAALVMEATRRKDEWKHIRNIIPDSDVLYLVDNEGRANLRELDTDPEMMRVLRYLDGRHSLDAIAEIIGASRFDTHTIVAQLVAAKVARPRSTEDVLSDALAMRDANELAKAKELLENALRQSRAPEILRPLAETSAALGSSARAVELYLELIQKAQDEGDMAAALADLDVVLGISPDDPELHFDRAQIRAELGRLEEAAEGYVAAAQAFLGTKDIDRALDSCHRAKNLLPRAPEPHRYLAKAFLLDGQTDNAVVEYKALWHALLTSHRPGKALDELKSILDADCKYAAVKNQALSHAQNSEVVKTHRVVRGLAYAVITVVLGCSAVAGWTYYQRVVVKDQGKSGIQDIKASLAARQADLEHPKILADIDRLRSRYGSDPDLSVELDALANTVRRDFDNRAQSQLGQGRTLLDGGKFDLAEAAFVQLRDRFVGTQAGTGAAELIEKVRQARIATDVQKDTSEAERRWQAFDWDGAIGIMEKVVLRQDLPSDLRAELVQRIGSWVAQNRTARDLSGRARAIEAQGDLATALVAWRRAAAGEGEAADPARDQARRVELLVAQAMGKTVQERAMSGDVGAFTILDDLRKLAQDAANGAVRSYLAQLEVPFLLEIDYPQVSVTIRRAGRPDDVIRAPDGSTGPWQHRISYHPDEVVQVAFQRVGFATETAQVSAAARKTSLSVALVRGPRWRSDLPGNATTAPVAAGKMVLVTTGRSTLEIADPSSGALRSVPFADTVAEFKAPPLLWNSRAYLVVEDGISAVDVVAGARLWSWDSGSRRLNGALWIQDHELIQGQMLALAGLARGGLLPLGIDSEGRATPYPVIDTDGDVTGAPIALHVGNRTVAYVPAANQLLAYDISATTETSPPVLLFTVKTKGDLISRPRPATILGRPALLVADASGLVVAIDSSLDCAESRRLIGSWPVEGTGVSAPVIDGTAAFVTTAEGRVFGLDLARPGVVPWRFPAKGTLGEFPGLPAIGRKGIYAAAANGILSCIDRTTGRERWHADLGFSAVGGVLARDGVVLVALRNGQLLAFDEGED